MASDIAPKRYYLSRLSNCPVHVSIEDLIKVIANYTFTFFSEHEALALFAYVAFLDCRIESLAVVLILICVQRAPVVVHQCSENPCFSLVQDGRRPRDP